MQARRSSDGASKVRAVVPPTLETTSARAGSAPMRPAWMIMRAVITAALAQRAALERRPLMGCVRMACSLAGGLAGGVGVEVAVADGFEALAGLVPGHGEQLLVVGVEDVDGVRVAAGELAGDHRVFAPGAAGGLLLGDRAWGEGDGREDHQEDHVERDEATLRVDLHAGAPFTGGTPVPLVLVAALAGDDVGDADGREDDEDGEVGPESGRVVGLAGRSE